MEGDVNLNKTSLLNLLKKGVGQDLKINFIFIFKLISIID